MFDEKFSKLLTLEAFGEWTGKQDPNGEYTYTDTGVLGMKEYTKRCALTQYFRQNGYPNAVTCAWNVYTDYKLGAVDSKNTMVDLPTELDAIVQQHRTFGSLKADIDEKLKKRTLETA